jgi:peroxiredoxin
MVALAPPLLFVLFALASFSPPPVAATPPTPPRCAQQAPSPGRRDPSGTSGEAEWQKLADEVTPKLVRFKALSDEEKKKEKFDDEIARIAAFVKKYETSEPATAGNARIFLAQQILADALHREREAVGVLRDVVEKCPDGFVAAAAAVRAAQYLVALGDEAALKELRALYVARPDHEPSFVEALDLYCRRVLAQPGRPFPDLPLVDSEGKAIDAKSLRGKLVVVLFFNALNDESRKELDHLVQFLARTSDEAVTAVGVSLDKDKRRLADTLREAGVKFPVACDGKEWKGPLAVALGLDKIPATFLLDPSGKILVSRLGTVGGELGTLVDEQLAKLRKAGALPPAPKGR